jgi:hypothetical protein
MVWPDSPAVWRNVDRWPDAKAKESAYKVFRWVDAFSPARRGINPSEDGDIPALRFSPAAQELFDEWRAKLEARLRSDELKHPAIEAHLAKYRSLMPSLALLLHLAECSLSEWHPMVRESAALAAAAWCEYLESHARRMYASAIDPATESAKVLLERIRRGDLKDKFSPRDVYHARHWSMLSTPEEVLAALRVLEDYGWLVMETVPTGGRPAIKVHLHPSLRGSAA